MKKTFLTFSTALAFSTMAMTAMGMSKTPSPEPVDEAVVYPAPETVVRFIAIGDSGTGEDGQYKVADACALLSVWRAVKYFCAFG